MFLVLCINKILLVACYCAVQLSMGISVAGGCDTSMAAVCYGWLYPGQIQMQSSNPSFNLLSWPMKESIWVHEMLCHNMDGEKLV